jgi:hypothetical protein
MPSTFGMRMSISTNGSAGVHANLAIGARFPHLLDVWLVGDSHRWAAGVILLVGVFACGLGAPGRGAATRLLATLGALALVLAVLALVTASLTLLSLLVVDIVVLWALSTLGHIGHRPRMAPRA